MMPEEESFYSEDTQEIMGVVPNRFVRWGVSVIGLIFVGILIGSYFIRYPETVQAPAVVFLKDAKAADTTGFFLEEKTGIVPDSCCITAQAYLPSKGFGKVALGQTVYVSLDCFPEMEFGKLKGKIVSICTRLQNSCYAVEIGFPTGVRTTYGKRLSFLSEMQGNCEVVTQDKRLIDCFTEPVRQLFGK